MKKDIFQREKILIGEDNFKKINKAKIIIYGIGGVGSFVTEGLVRAGVQNITLVDNDVVDISNINRQIEATTKTVGKPKIDVMRERLLEINPDALITVYNPKELDFSEEELITESYDYVVDSCDTVCTKINLVQRATDLKVPIISCMGAANKLDATKFEITDIFKTKVDPLAKVMRKELKKRNINKLKVIYSTAKVVEHEEVLNEDGKKILGSISYVPSVEGLLVAGEIIKDLLNK